MRSAFHLVAFCAFIGTFVSLLIEYIDIAILSQTEYVTTAVLSDLLTNFMLSFANNFFVSRRQPEVVAHLWSVDYLFAV